ncbi:protein FAR1-RELATED SEQUENCE 5-like [Gastrolobium bilobum]|uniref:protein FAR1-RELATED SEQUENCE 5-like n=1 Tax=Gastrolobium bilobum TaxID=150636 RepID=UPI002AB1CEEF|nr:protein FAR1-RELATED SEQUENCE 5-like [Gastrolobium bilobum]
MDHSHITTIEDIDISGSLVYADDVVDLEKDNDEFREDEQCKIFDDENGECGEDNVHEIVGDDDSGLSEAPILGRVFKTAEEAYGFNNDYAQCKGFGIRKQYTSRKFKTQEIYRWNYVCSKQGVKKQNHKRVDVENVKRRRDSRTNCSAMLQEKLVDELWIVEKFNDAHNHPLMLTPSKVRKFHSHSDLLRSNFTKSLVSKLFEEGLTSSKISKRW